MAAAEAAAEAVAVVAAAVEEDMEVDAVAVAMVAVAMAAATGAAVMAAAAVMATIIELDNDDVFPYVCARAHARYYCAPVCSTRATRECARPPRSSLRQSKWTMIKL